MRVEDGFQQPAFIEGHPYLDDLVLPSLLRRLCSPKLLEDIEPDLIRFGGDITNNIREVANRATPPTLTQYTHWGVRIDDLNTSESWRSLKSTCQQEGIPGIFYERPFGDMSRTIGFVKEMMMAGDGQVVFCPLSMTDGCARVIELFGTETMKKEILPRLISRDPTVAFTSGQWMTEKTGGSDVSQTETIAVSTGITAGYGPVYKLDGFKWFSSATDGDVALALARTGHVSQGSRSLSLFLVPLRLPLHHDPKARPSSTNNGILVHRLKNKFGTQIVPTAELSLNNTEAYLIGELNQGVKQISSVLNITRIHSAVGSVGYLRRALDIARSFARVRRIGTNLLKGSPLHLAELSKISVTYRALLHLTVGVVGLLGQVECRTPNSSVEGRLRLLMPVTKGFCAEKGVQAMTECMTALGGQGYMEENAIGRLIRDGMVEQIWEGTTTVLSLDVMRAVQRTDSLTAFAQWTTSVLDSCLEPLRTRIASTIETLQSSLETVIQALKPPVHILSPRPVFFLLGYLASSIYLLEHAIWSMSKQDYIDADALVFWVEDGLIKAKEDVLRIKETEMPVLERLVYGSKL